MSSSKILPPTPENIRKAAESLRRGEIGGMPTETVYGLAGSALDPRALAKIFEMKERPTFDPLIVHLPESMKAGGIEALRDGNLVDSAALSFLARKQVKALIAAFWPGPLTLVLPKLPAVPDLATSGLPTVALRMPAHPVAQALLSSAGVPLAAPSANRFGRISPTTAEHVIDELGDRIAWVLDGGICDIGVESTVLSIDTEGRATVLRPGGLSRENIEAVTGPLSEKPAATSGAQQAPGMLESHYAPKKRLLLLESSFNNATIENDAAFKAALDTSPKSLGLLLISGDPQSSALHLSKWTSATVLARTLSVHGDLEEAARNLFSTLRELDQSDADLLLAEPCLLQRGLGFAIADRLRRASAHK